MDDLDRAADRELHLLDRAVNREDALNRTIARSITISTIVASAAIFGALYYLLNHDRTETASMPSTVGQGSEAIPAPATPRSTAPAVPAPSTAPTSPEVAPTSPSPE